MTRNRTIYPIMHLIGSTKGQNRLLFTLAERYYTAKGYIVFKPVFFDLPEDDPNLQMYTDMCTQKLLACDVVCVVTDHIGDSTKKRIAQAKQLRKPVIFFKDAEVYRK